MATPTAALARVSKASIPATPAANATTKVEALTAGGVNAPGPFRSISAPRRPNARSTVTTVNDAALARARPTASVPTARDASLTRRPTIPTQAAVSGRRSGLTAMAPTIRIELPFRTPNAAIVPAMSMNARYRATMRDWARASPRTSDQIRASALRANGPSRRAGPMRVSRARSTSSAGMSNRSRASSAASTLPGSTSAVTMAAPGSTSGARAR